MTTPENMVERVARAMARDKWVRKHHTKFLAQNLVMAPTETEAAIAQIVDGIWGEEIDSARVAIAAMREPTLEMVEAGRSVAVKPPDWMNLKPFGDGPYVYKSFMSPENTAAHFTAMIDEALKE